MELITTLLLILPLTGFLIIGLLSAKLNKTYSGIIASGAIFINLIISLILFWDISKNNNVIEAHLFDWIKFADINIHISLIVDRLSALMLLIINGVGLLIHIYSIGYMKNDPGVNKFFAYLNLFVFFMLILVLGSNYMVLFIGWEGVGLASYLLIGFWYTDHENNNAAKKAFVMNRIGDLGFLIGVFIIFLTFKTLSIAEISALASTYAVGDLTILAITICLFIGAVGKSAQLPLFTWLPDAMAGPTPVSALIHAATMVTAGIYLVARSSVLFVLSPLTLDIILIVGAITAIVASITAIYQYDIKKILAYSTVSQLGFMFMALGMGAFSGAMFHLTTHAFFKALLFLGAGSVIHALNNEQDIRNMGGLRKKIPYTFMLFLIGTIAISGIPPFAGFFSKEMILTSAFEHSFGVGILTTVISLLTTIYMFRLLFIAFYKNESEAVKNNHHVHESPKVMIYPMAILALLSVFSGFIEFPKLFAESEKQFHFSNYLAPVFSNANALFVKNHIELDHKAEWLIFTIPLAIVFTLIFVLSKLYSNNKPLKTLTGIRLIGARKFYLDEIYNFLIVKPTMWLSVFIREKIDQSIINNFVNSIGNVTLFAGKKIRYIQTGNVGFYLFIMVFSIITILFINIIL